MQCNVATFQESIRIEHEVLRSTEYAVSNRNLYKDFKELDWIYPAFLFTCYEHDARAWK